ncbi:hypothetical protein AX16_009431 [Volvariella volvacea WC 439]|nr:hypothetical protein AX16_009431 [Volvariella volvacea WC 439]
MFLASLFLAAFARSLASPVPVTVSDSGIPSPICIIAAAATASQCDPTRIRTIFDILPKRFEGEGDVDKGYDDAICTGRPRNDTHVGDSAEDHGAEDCNRGWTRTHGFFVQMGGLVQLQPNSGYRVICDLSGLEGVQLPRIPEKEIKDHGKGDLLAKAIVVLQTTWFVAQCIARRVAGLVLTEIELVTLAFATLNVITYGLWWDKPLNIEYPIYFDEKGNRIDGPEEVKSESEGVWSWFRNVWGNMDGYSLLEGGNEFHRQGVMKTIWKKGIEAPFLAAFSPLWNMMTDEGDNRATSVHPFYAAEMNGDTHGFAIIYGAAIGVLFGGLHLIGWEFEFPTRTELWLWRASSLVLTVTPLVLAIAVAFELLSGKTGSHALDQFCGFGAQAFLYLTIILGPPLYFGARIVILFLAFFTLRDLPDSAYQNVRWTDYIPHI